MKIDDITKCRCRGSNSECFQCFGSGVITPTNEVEIPSANLKRPARLPSISILDPSFTQRPGKLSMEQAIISHGSIDGNKNIAQSLARTVRISKYLRDADPSTIGPHANALLETIKSALQFDKHKFNKFIKGMNKIISSESASLYEKSKQLNIRSALLQGSLKFTEFQVAIMDEAFRLANSAHYTNNEEPIGELLIRIKSLLESLEPTSKNPAPSSVPLGKSGLVLISPDNILSDEQINKFEERLDNRKIDHVYFIGTDEGFGDFKARYRNLSSLHVTTNDELKSVMKSSSVSTLRLVSENKSYELSPSI